MKYLFLAIASCTIYSCDKTSQETDTVEYLNMVGDSKYNSEWDEPTFKSCYGDTTFQYFNFSNGFQYIGEKQAILEAFSQQYQPLHRADQTGLIRIRFLVNCKGKTGRYRLMGMDEHYNEKDFDEEITNQLMSITKNLNGWKLLPDSIHSRDYYQYLIFKLETGEIKEILP